MLTKHRSFFSTKGEKEFSEMSDSRAKTREIIGRLTIPKTTVAQLSGLSGTEVSAYIHGHTVSDTNCMKIEHAVEAVADLISFMQRHFSLRPDLKDIESLRAAIAELKSARNFVAAQQQLARAEGEATAALGQIAGA